MKVKFLPKNTIPTIKCNHRYGAKMTFSFQTDARYSTSIYAAEIYGFKNNFRLGAFVNNINPGQSLDDINITEQTGLFRHDIYYPTDYWKNPITNVVEVIPDYYNTQWTAAGATLFNKNIGDPKIATIPRHGQNMYDLSGGKFGYDFVNGRFGDSNLSEIVGLDDYVQSWLFSNIGRYASSLSYRNGDNSGARTHTINWISGRNSFPSPATTSSPAPTQYGSNLGYPLINSATRSFWVDYPSSFRWWDSFNNNGVAKADATNYMTTNIQSTLLNNGWYRDFMHFHAARSNNTLSQIDEFMQIANSAFGNNFVWKCSNGEAMEYMFLREITNRIIATEKNNKVVIILDIEDKYKGLLSNYPQNIPLNRLNIPLSVQIDLTGTSLAGKNIISNFGKIISKGNNIYIVEVPFNHKELFQAVVLEEGTNGYFDTNIPTGTKIVSNNILTVSTNINTKAVLFSVDTNGNIYDSIVISRSNIFSKTHIFNISSGKDYRIGIISEFGQANLI